MTFSRIELLQVRLRGGRGQGDDVLIVCDRPQMGARLMESLRLFLPGELNIRGICRRGTVKLLGGEGIFLWYSFLRSLNCWLSCRLCGMRVAWPPRMQCTKRWLGLSLKRQDILSKSRPPRGRSDT